MTRPTKKERERALQIYQQVVKMEGILFVFPGLFGEKTVTVPAEQIYRHILQCVIKARKRHA